MDQVRKINDQAIEAVQKGKFLDAIKLLKKALKKNPKDENTLNNLITTLILAKKYKQALNVIKSSIKLGANPAQSYYTMGSSYKLSGDLKNAIKYYELALKHEPDSSHFLNNLGVIYGITGKYKKSINMFNKALKINPKQDAIFVNLGAVYADLGNLDKAIEAFQKAIKLNKTNASAHSNLGNTLRMASSQIDALKFAEKATNLSPKSASAHRNLGFIYADLQKNKLALSALKKSLAIDPDHGETLANFLYIKRKICDWRNMTGITKKWKEYVKKSLKQSDTSISPFSAITLTENISQSTRLAQIWSNKVEKWISKQAPKFSYNFKNKKLRIGYVSDNFHDHPVSYCTYSLFGNHNKKKFDIYVYSYGINPKNKYFNAVINGATRFKNIIHLDYTNAAQTINKDKIDILVDLKGYTHSNRLEILAAKPAPVQISYLGFPGSTGANFFDYLIADTYVIPSAYKKFYSEKLVLLPPTYQYTSPIIPSKNKYSKSDFQLPADKFIFSCFNRSIKINQKTFNLFIKILKKCPDSVLWLYEDLTDAKINLTEYAISKGVAKQRLIFSKRLPIEKHIKRLSLTDLALDPVGYSGGNTTSNYLIAGVPVITLPEKQFISRMTGSILTSVKMDDLIVKSEEEYVEKCVNIYKNNQQLSSLKEKLTESHLKKTLLNTKQFTSNLEKAYETIWKNHKQHVKKTISIN